MITEETVVPVHSIESERYVIGAVLWHRNAVHEVSDMLKPEHFYNAENANNWRAVLALNADGLQLDVTSILLHRKAAESWKEGRFGTVAFELSRIQSEAFGSLNIEYHAAIIMQLWSQREGVKLSAAKMAEGQDHNTDALDYVESLRTEAEKIASGFVRRRAVSFAEGEAEEIEKMDGEKKPIHTSGLPEVDKITGGYQRGDLTIVAARPGMGKTAYLVSSASLAAEAGHRCGVFSMELTQEKFQARMFSRRSRVPLATIVLDKMEADDIRKRHQGLSDGGTLPLWTRYDTALTLADIRAEATRMVRKHGVTCIYIDQLNWITPPKSGNRDAEVGAITRGLKQLAIQLDIAVVLLHQLGRDTEKRGGDKRPKLHDLRDSGNVEQDAQLVILLYRPEYYKIAEDENGSTLGIVEAIIAKNSNGPIDIARLKFDAPTASVWPLETEYAHAAPHPDNRTTATKDEPQDLPF